jgi:drug/metabolite transporter (DMT)-like permease
LAAVARGAVEWALKHLSASFIAVAVVTNLMLGNLLALVGSLTVCAYLLIDRKLRAGVGLLPYIWLMYSASALCLMALALISGQKLLGFSDFAWLMLAGLALGPQLLGHSAVNWALKHLSASFIAVAILGEPVGSAILAWLFLGERFAALLVGFFSCEGRMNGTKIKPTRSVPYAYSKKIEKVTLANKSRLGTISKP